MTFPSFPTSSVRGASSVREAFPVRETSSLRDAFAILAGLGGPFLAALLLLPLRASVTHTNLALLLVVVVVAVSALGNRFAGALAALSAAAWFDFFHTEPYQSFHIQGRADVETAVLLLVVGLVVSQLAARGRTLGRAALADASHLERLHGVTRLARHSTDADEVVQRVRRELVDVLDLQACRFVHGASTGDPARLEPDGSVTVPGWIWDLERQGWPYEEIELPAVVHGRSRGRYVLTPAPGAVPPPLEARLVAVDLAVQAAAALDGAPAPGAVRP
ncbi:DUF4118 domain-containing protein [Streptomyces sp. NPDC097704]|uniref:DUF4118 domain-containing protein n=1 Tax=Streptomyces sp. NPDC097704 TaxID=3157101 RepID=UPI00332DE7B6